MNNERGVQSQGFFAKCQMPNAKRPSLRFLLRSIGLEPIKKSNKRSLMQAISKYSLPDLNHPTTDMSTDVNFVLDERMMIAALQLPVDKQ